ncbi:MAG: PKD domain-containing protein, partial [Solirubrobacteraceae bacterium]
AGVTAPAIVVSGAAGADIEDAVVFSQYDDAILISAGTTNRIIRTLAATGGGSTSAVRVESTTGTPAKALTLESTMLIGGGAGLGVYTSSAEIEAAAGDVEITARHITAAGSSNGLELDSSNAKSLLATSGNIAMTMTDSITLDNAIRRNPGVINTGLGSNTATLDATRSLLTGDRGTLFGDAPARNFRLRPNSPAIGQGGVTPGESPADVDGEDRAAAPTDLGADEYNNAAPVAKIAVKTNPPRANQPLQLDASASADREAGYGGGITQYRWRFSDGKDETGSTPTISHTFPAEGDAAVTLVVVDNQGAVSAPVTIPLKLIDGTPPTVAIVKPKNGQKLKRFTTRRTTTTVDGVKQTTSRRARTRITFGGLARDKNGVSRVILTLEKLSSSTRTGARASQSAGRKCNWFNPRAGITRRSCQKPVLITARLKKGSASGEWTYTLKRSLGRGSYRLRAFGVDKTGAFGNAGSRNVGVVRFTFS